MHALARAKKKKKPEQTHTSDLEEAKPLARSLARSLGFLACLPACLLACLRALLRAQPGPNGPWAAGGGEEEAVV